MSGRRRRQFDKIESENDIQVERKGDNKRCIFILLAVGVVVFIALTTEGSIHRIGPLKPKTNSTDQNSQEEIKSNGVNHDTEAKISKATQVTGENGNKYNLLRQYVRGGIYYTQGFKHISANKFLESGGLYKRSTIQYVTVELGKETKELYSNVEEKMQKHLDDKYFGEGCDIFNDRNGVQVIYQLTWKERKILKYDMDLNLIGEIELPQPIKEGWGLAVDDNEPKYGYISDGSSIVYKVNTTFYEINDGKETQKFKILDKFQIKDSKGKIYPNINELEFVDGYLWANKYMSNLILKIDITTGRVIKIYDMTYLVHAASMYATSNRGRKLGYGEVLNGIAYNKEYKIFYVTGKDWPLIFEVEFLN